MFERPGLLYVIELWHPLVRQRGLWARRGRFRRSCFGSGRPLVGEETMVLRRGRTTNLTVGPGNLCSALGINGSYNGIDLLDPSSPIRLVPGSAPAEIVVSPRIGITKATELPWRFASK